VAEALILDSEAVTALARASQRSVLAERSRAVVQVAYEKGALVRIPCARARRGMPRRSD
jgi:hypothetical protein